MHIRRLSLHQVRRFDTVELAPKPGINLITGDNGAGKTSVLEALHVMAYGRSFRGRVRDGLVRQGREALDVFVEWDEQREGAETPTRRKAGLRHSGQEWKGRLDGEDVAQLGTLCAALAVVTFEPGSHALVSGGGEPRRRFLDWGLFHVEPDFMGLWRRYSRALKQRNALLKQGGHPHALDAWDRARRSRRTADHPPAALSGAVAGTHRGTGRRPGPNLGIQSLSLSPGWRKQEVSLSDALLLARERDRMAGYTSVGPHRADWSVGFETIPGRDALSRGQAKLTALTCLLAQAEDYAEQRGEWPVIALDDLSSELDRHHQARVLERLKAGPAQIFITATEVPAALIDATDITRFHVEHGQVQPVP